MIIHNPTTTNVRDYPIQNPETKEVRLWTVMSGETLEFPDFAGQYLLQIYGFLQRVVTEEQVRAEEAEKRKVDSGMKFSQTKVLKATPVEVVAPEKQKGFTNAVVKTPAGQEIAKPKLEQTNELESTPVDPKPLAGQKVVVQDVQVVGEQGIACHEETCKERFQSEHTMKMHYASKHLNFAK